jgi:hypothetical protein
MSKFSQLGAGKQERQKNALFALQQWLRTLYQQKLATYDDDGVVRLSADVARRFTLGVVGEDLFIALQQEELGWASAMPWQYAAVYSGKRDLHLIAAPMEIDLVDTAPFGLSFQMTSVAEATSLTTYGMLGLRGFASGIQCQTLPLVTRMPFATFPIYLLAESVAIFDAGNKNPSPPSGRGGT